MDSWQNIKFKLLLDRYLVQVKDNAVFYVK